MAPEKDWAWILIIEKVLLVREFVCAGIGNKLMSLQ